MYAKRSRQLMQKSAVRRHPDRQSVCRTENQLAVHKKIALTSLKTLMEEKQRVINVELEKYGKTLLEVMIRTETELHDHLKADTLEYASQRKEHYQQRLEAVRSKIPARYLLQWEEYVSDVRLLIDIESSKLLDELEADHIRVISKYVQHCVERFKAYESDYAEVCRSRMKTAVSNVTKASTHEKVFLVVATIIYEINNEYVNQDIPPEAFIKRHSQKERSALRAKLNERLKFMAVDREFNIASKGNRWSDIEQYAPISRSLPSQ